MATVTIPKERFEKLVADSAHLNALINRGVDNWNGYVGPGWCSCPECGDDVHEDELTDQGLCTGCGGDE